MAAGKNTLKEPSVVIRPLGRLGGLDSIHVSLAVLVVVLIALLLAVAYTKPAPILPQNQTASNKTACAYGTVSGKCAVPSSSANSIRLAAERELAGYNYVNTSLSLLPYLSDVGNMSMAYDPLNSEWYVSVPYVYPSTGETFGFAMMINDKNTSKITPFIQTLRPALHTGSLVVSKGVVLVQGKSPCTVQSPMQVYWFVDPYAPGSIASLSNMTSLQGRLGSKVNVTMKLLFTQSSQAIAAEYGINESLALGDYLFCTSNQGRLPQFLSKLESIYGGSYVPPSELSGMAGQSGINSTQLSSCLSSMPTTVNRQALLAKYYNITSASAVVTDCQYLSIPSTALDAVHYANSSIV